MKHQKGILLVAATCLLALYSSVSTSHAALIAYDGFESGGATPGAGQYETGTGYGGPGDALVVGANPGGASQGPTTTGFSSSQPWEYASFIGGGGFASSVYYQASATGLTYSDGSGNVLDSRDGSVRHLHESTPLDKSISRTINSQPTPSTVAYYSFLINPTSEDNNWNSTAELAVQQGGSRHTGFRITTSGQLEAFASFGGVTDLGPTLNLNQDNFIVVRLEELGGNSDSMHVWLNPALDAEPPLGTADASITSDFIYVGGNASFPFDTLALNAVLDNNGAANPEDFVYFDEFRLGDTFADVTPFTAPAGIPEPSTILLSGLALAGLALSRRR